MLAAGDKIDARYYEPDAARYRSPSKKTAVATPKGDMEEQNGGRHNPTAGAVKSANYRLHTAYFCEFAGKFIVVRLAF